MIQDNKVEAITQGEYGITITPTDPQYVYVLIKIINAGPEEPAKEIIGIAYTEERLREIHKEDLIAYAQKIIDEAKDEVPIVPYILDHIRYRYWKFDVKTNEKFIVA